MVAHPRHSILTYEEDSGWVFPGPCKVSRLFFAAPWDLRMGIQLSVPGMGDRFLFGRLSMVVADEAALKQL